MYQGASSEVLTPQQGVPGESRRKTLVPPAPPSQYSPAIGEFWKMVPGLGSVPRLRLVGSWDRPMFRELYGQPSDVLWHAVLSPYGAYP